MRVLESVAPPSNTVKYIDQVVRYAPADIAFDFFSWRKALFGRYDVLHVHWPEYFTRAGRPVVSTVKRLLFRVLLRRLRRRRTAVVRTVHNVRPHADGDAVEQTLLDRLDALTTQDVALNPCTASRGIPSTVIPHGDYREQFAGAPRAMSVPGRLLFVGRIEEYKGVLELIDVVRGMSAERVHLRIVGNPTASMRRAIAQALQAATPTHPRITTVLEFVSDQALVEEISSAQLVVLPYREMHNSGILLVALSLDRPVLVPRSCANAAIAEEVGAAWVTQYAGVLEASHILEALEGEGRRDATGPVFDQRDWRSVAQAYGEVFRAAARA